MLSLDATMKDMRVRMKILLRDRNTTAGEVSNFAVPNGGMPNLFSRWIQGEVKISARKAFIIAERLNVSPDFAFMGIGSLMNLDDLYSSVLSLEEKDLFVHYQNMPPKGKAFVLNELKNLVPQNVFFKTDFVNHNNGDYEKAEEEITDLLIRCGKNLKSLLKAHKRTQKELAEFLGVNPALCTKVIKGERIISLDMIIGTAGFLGMTLSDILFHYTAPEKIKNFDADASDLIVYFRMLGNKDKGKILAIAKALATSVAKA